MRNVILNILRHDAHASQELIRYLKKEKGKAWEQATPDTAVGRDSFARYSKARSDLKKERAHLTKVNAAIKAVKKGLF